jgi:uncharacterized alpha-E superfamily protein
VRFSINSIVDALGHVAQGAPPSRRAICERLAGRLKATVDFGLDEMASDAVDDFLIGVTKHCEQIHDAVYAAYIAYDAEAVL